MNAILLLCRRCHQICGCTGPAAKSCRGCVSHDCPVLPAPKRREGFCEFCLERSAPVGSRAGLPRPGPSG